MCLPLIYFCSCYDTRKHRDISLPSAAASHTGLVQAVNKRHPKPGQHRQGELLCRNDVAHKHTTHTPRLALTRRNSSALCLLHEQGKKRAQAHSCERKIGRQRKENVKIKRKGKDTKEFICPRNKATFSSAGWGSILVSARISLLRLGF